MALLIATWKWGKKYPLEYVSRLKAGIARNMRQEYRFAVFGPEEEDEHLTEIPGCFCRLRMFDPEWQEKQGIENGDRIVCIDLDVVVTGDLEPLFDREDPFLILQGANASNPCPYNGSIWSLIAGYRPDVWVDFSLDAAKAVAHDRFPDDQAWLADRIPTATGWRVGSESGIYAFKKPGWPKGDELPKDARLVAFPGWRDPQHFKHLPWIKEHWRA